LEAVQRANNILEEKYESVSLELKKRDADHHKAMTDYKLSLDLMKVEVILVSGFPGYNGPTQTLGIFKQWANPGLFLIYFCLFVLLL